MLRMAFGAPSQPREAVRTFQSISAFDGSEFFAAAKLRRAHGRGLLLRLFP